MRFIVEAKVPLEAGNTEILNNSLMHLKQNYLTEIKPEAAYFTLKEGQRTMFAVVDIESVNKLPATLEPLWLNLKCDVQVYPAMVFEDFQKAKEDFEKILSKRK